ncbi:hypothetical protein HanXRQr2_Chr15g0691641 [Helianthus annuus]|uniref:Uncharacterized protein n=1 Tax=Helianthus annuus TaxID=4232 RepID=A0A251S9U2_HELAN|nr:hypothetical protein HanXRQr2_Chr15g0691641 [Helianthus annuus]KAJ0831132.1 hypothetical protein HanPSC8_Chr15g0663491 [Helianthus annuus]
MFSPHVVFSLVFNRTYVLSLSRLPLSAYNAVFSIQRLLMCKWVLIHYNLAKDSKTYQYINEL